MKIDVLADNSSYLTKEQCEKCGIDMLSTPIIWDSRKYFDSIDIGFHESHKKLNSSTTLSTTSQPSTGITKKYVEKYVVEGYIDLIIIVSPSDIPSSYSNALSVASEGTRINIHPFDYKVTCAGEAGAAILAGRLVEAGADINLTMHDLRDLRDIIGVRFMVDSLNHLKQTGRLLDTANFTGFILKVKLILSVDAQSGGKTSATAKER